MNAPGHQTFAFSIKFQWASEGLWPWFNAGRISLRLFWSLICLVCLFQTFRTKNIVEFYKNYYLNLIFNKTEYMSFNSFWALSFNPFLNKPLFLRVRSTGLLKTLWVKEKSLVTVNFSFSHSVFFQFGEFNGIFLKCEFAIYILVQSGRI